MLLRELVDDIGEPDKSVDSHDNGILSLTLVQHEGSEEGELPHPDTPLDYLRTTLGNLLNGGRWAQDAELQAWLGHSRLDFLSAPDEGGEVDEELAQRLAAGAEAAVEKLERWLAEVDASASVDASESGE